MWNESVYTTLYFTEKDMTDSIPFNDEIEWDTKTLASAVKLYFG